MDSLPAKLELPQDQTWDSHGKVYAGVALDREWLQCDWAVRAADQDIAPSTNPEAYITGYTCISSGNWPVLGASRRHEHRPYQRATAILADVKSDGRDLASVIFWRVWADRHKLARKTLASTNNKTYARTSIAG
jgi:hypothetical protein